MGPSMLILHIDGPMGVSIHVDKNDSFLPQKSLHGAWGLMPHIHVPLNRSTSMVENPCPPLMFPMTSVNQCWTLMVETHACLASNDVGKCF